MISIHQFKKWNEDVQLDYLNLYGTNLDISRFKGNIELVLYALHNFYVEVGFQRWTSDIRSISSFSATRKLEGYLKQINIDEITEIIN
jgi:hypothetical protein